MSKKVASRGHRSGRAARENAYLPVLLRKGEKTFLEGGCHGGRADSAAMRGGETSCLLSSGFSECLVKKGGFRQRGGRNNSVERLI